MSNDSLNPVVKLFRDVKAKLHDTSHHGLVVPLHTPHPLDHSEQHKLQLWNTAVKKQSKRFAIATMLSGAKFDNHYGLSAYLAYSCVVARSMQASQATAVRRCV